MLFRNKFSFAVSAAAVVLAFFFAVSAHNAHPQSSTTLLLRGTIINQHTSAPVAVKYKITGPGNKILKGKSRSDGTFEQILEAGASYTILFSGHDILRQKDTLNMPAVDKYMEEKRDFPITVLKSGLQLKAFSAFEAGQSTLTASGRSKLDEVLKMVKQNRSLYVSVQALPDAGKGESLANSRKAAIEEHIKSAKKAVKRRISVKSNAKAANGDNVVVAVTKVKNPFE